MDTTTLKVPGFKLAEKDEQTIAGLGTYEKNGIIYSSIVGFMQRETLPDGKVKISVTSDKQQTVVPSIGAVVTAKITTVSARFCKCIIMSVGKTTLKEPVKGMIRKEDVRATEKDRVETYKSFRPGDMIVARVLSLGDAQSYLLSTAENELGVVIATSEAGATLIPISWCTMQCPITLREEFRKVARVQPQFLEYVEA